jgi:hypothetical protein
MGGSKSESKTRETELSREQARILRIRQEQYEQYFFPEIVRELQSSSDTAALARPQVEDIGLSQQVATKQFESQMARRGLAGSGVEAAGLSNIQEAGMQARSGALQSALMQGRQQRMSALQMGLSGSPTPTTAAPLGQESKASSFKLG